MANILVVEDNAQVAKLFRDILTRAGHHAVVAANGNEAILAFGQQAFDLIITDIFMPEKDGLELIREVMAQNPGLKVIAISGGGKTRAPLYLEMAKKLGAAAHHIFLLVPTGRGREMASQAITAAEYEETLLWFHEESRDCSIQLKATCAPHYFRILHQNKIKGEEPKKKPGGRFHESTRGCLGGISFCFISHIGQVQPCGYLELDCGNVQKQSFAQIWENSEVFRNLRDLSKYGGKCGRCEFIKVCGGCRARAYEATGDYLSEEPLCLYKSRL